MKRQVNVRLSDASMRKLAYLARFYGTQTTAIEVAIEALSARLPADEDEEAAAEAQEMREDWEYWQSQQ